MNSKAKPHCTLLYTLAMTLSLLPVVAYSADQSLDALGVQSHESIQEAVQKHVLGRTVGKNTDIEVELNSIDSRLRLKKCDHPLETKIRGTGELRGRIAIAVKCSSPKAWKFYLGATVRQFGNAVVAKQGIPRGTVLSRSDVRIEHTELSQLRQGYYRDISDIVGMVAKRTLTADKPIGPNSLNRKQLVSRGDKVTIRAVLSGVEVRMYGEALADGANGERISVKNLNSDRIINAVVTSQGIVTVTL